MTCLRANSTFSGRDSRTWRAHSVAGASPATRVKKTLHCRQNAATAASSRASSLVATMPRGSRLGNCGLVANLDNGSSELQRAEVGCWLRANAPAHLRANPITCERSELPAIARLVQGTSDGSREGACQLSG